MRRLAGFCMVLAIAPRAGEAQTSAVGLRAEAFRPYVETFNRNDDERTVNHIDNKSSWEWLQRNVPLFECSDKTLEEIYYFRWWTFRKHIKKTADGFVVTEFLPAVPWAGKHNTISCAAGHHFYEGRWLRNREYLDDYARFWFRKGGQPRLYSFWAADALEARALVTRDDGVPFDLLPDLIENYRQWEKTNQDPNGLFWQEDGKDGMEVSIGGHGYRATINSYMYGDAMAIAAIAQRAGKAEVAREFRSKAGEIRELVESRLWDEQAGFYQVLPRGEDGKRAAVRELHGYVPWYFNLPKPGREIAWKQLMDPAGFAAPYGPTTAERRHPRFMFAHQHDCLWNGPSWPYATTQTLVAMANLLNHYEQSAAGKKDYFQLLRTYASTHYRRLEDGRLIPWIDENYDPFSGIPIARTVLYRNKDKNKDRGRDYNHSGFNDLIITGLVGLRPRLDDTLEFNPLAPEGELRYFALTGVSYHGAMLDIFYDQAGERYGRGPGFHVYVNGRKAASAARLQRLTLPLSRR